MDPTSTSENGRQSRGLARFWPVHGMPVPAQRQSEEDGPSTGTDDRGVHLSDASRPAGDPAAAEQSYPPVPYDTSLYRPTYDPAGTGPASGDPTGDEPRGHGPTGHGPEARDAVGHDAATLDAAGRPAAHDSGQSPVASQRSGGHDTPGQTSVGQTAVGQTAAGQFAAGQSSAGRHPVPHPYAGQTPVVHGPAAYDRAAYDPATHDSSAHDPAVADPTPQDIAAHDPIPVRTISASVPPPPVVSQHAPVPPPYTVTPAPDQPPYAVTSRSAAQSSGDGGIAVPADEPAGRYGVPRAGSAAAPDTSGHATRAAYDRTSQPEATGDTEMVALGTRRGGYVDDRPLPDNVTPLRSWTGNQPGYAADTEAPGRNGDGAPRHGGAGRVTGGPGVNGAPHTAVPSVPDTTPALSSPAETSGAGSSLPGSSLSGTPLGGRPSGFATPAADLPATAASGLASVRSPFSGSAPAAPSPYSPLPHPATSGHSPAWTSEPSGPSTSGSTPPGHSASVLPSGSASSGLSAGASSLSASGRSTAADAMLGAFLPANTQASPSPAALPVPAPVSAPAPDSYLTSMGGSAGWAPSALDAPSVPDRHGRPDRTVVPDRSDAVGRAEARWAGTVPDSTASAGTAPADAPGLPTAGAPEASSGGDAPATGRRSRAEEDPTLTDDAGASLRPGDVAQTRITLWDDEATRQFHQEWHEVKAQFVDDPVAALTRAHDLLTEAVHELTDALLAERDDLDPLRRTTTPDTESMRMAMRGYREFLDRILAL